MSIPIQHRYNFRHLYADTFWFGVLAGSAIAFMAIYAARLGASAFQISLLTAGPGVVNLISSFPAGRWLEKRNFMRVTFFAALLHRSGYVWLVFLPLLFSGAGQITILVTIYLLMALPGTALTIAFNAMFAEVVPPEYRGEVVGKRNALLAIGMTGTTLICGQLLNHIAFPLNYQIVFSLGMVGGLMSTYHLGRIQYASSEPPGHTWELIGSLARSGWTRLAGALRHPVSLSFWRNSGGRPLLRRDLLSGSSGLFLAAYLVFYAFQYLPVPLFPLVTVNQLKLSDFEISLGTGMFYLFMFLVSLRLGRLSSRLGHRWLLVIGALLYGFYPVFLGLAWDATLYWVASLTGGGVYAVVNASLVNRLMEKSPGTDRPAFMALHNLALNLGMLSGSLLGPLISGQLGLPNAMLLSGGLRFLAGFLLLVWG